MRGLTAIIRTTPAVRTPPAAPAPPARCGRPQSSVPRGAGPVAAASVNVLPVLVLQQPRHEREEYQEQDRPDADVLALQRGRLAGVLQERGDVTHGPVELLRVLAAGLADGEAFHRRLAGRGLLA